jgi:hypothetical protein
MQYNSVLFAFFVGGFSIQVHAASLRHPRWKVQGDHSAAPVQFLNSAPGAAPTLEVAGAPAAAAEPAASSEKGVGDLQAFAHLLPFHPRGQQELLMKTRCVNFLNHLLEKSAYAPGEVGKLMPKCRWSEEECGALKDDLLKRLAGPGGAAPAPAPAALVQQPIPERKAPKDSAVLWINGPRGPQPDFATGGGMDESIYGWCDTMYDMMRTNAIGELDEEQKKAEEKKAAAAEKATATAAEGAEVEVADVEDADDK